MAINSQPKQIKLYTEPLSINAEINIISGNPVQTYNEDTSEYEPDRTLVPLVLMPSVYAYDPESETSSERTVTSVEWYDGVPKSDKSNLISDGTDYELGDGTEEGIPNGALVVNKNIPTSTPKEIYAIFYFTDTRYNKSIEVERSIKLYSTMYYSNNYSLRIIDQPATWTINPLNEVADTTTGAWLHTITAQLYKGKDAVEDAHAAYWWQIFKDGEWVEVTADDIDFFLECKDSSGNFTKTLKFDARMITNVSFRCVASYYDTSRPSQPASDANAAQTTVKVEMPRTLKVDVVQTKGVKVKSDMSTEVSFTCNLSYNKAEIGTDKDGLFRFTWYGKSTATGSSEKKIGSGRTITFVPSQIGFPSGNPVSVYVKVEFYKCYAVVVDDDEYISDDDGNLVIDMVYA